LKKGDFPEISYNSKILLLGSCFSDEMGKMFDYYKIPCISNPFGVTYNPVSIQHQIRRIIEKDYFIESDLIKKNDLYNSYDLHGSFDRLKKNELQNEVNKVIRLCHDFIKNASHLYVTLGTSWVYENKTNNKIVNNCHKKPANNFTKRILSVDEVYGACSSIIELCTSLNKKLKYIFTISPVRHLKDGFTENSLSKGILRVAIGKIEERNMVFYFPSNEILNDDLRDYRFFGEDLIHPNKTAINYIWNQIAEFQFKENDKILMKKIEKLNTALNHNSFNAESQGNQIFIKETIEFAEKLQDQYQNIDLEIEIVKLKSRLSE